MNIMGEERERFSASAWRDFENAINDIYERLEKLEKGQDTMENEFDYRWCWFQLRHRANAEHNKMVDIIVDAYENK